MAKPKTFDKPLHKYRLQCTACGVMYGEKDAQCPACGSKMVRILPSPDIRRTFAYDNRRVGPI